MTVFDNIKRISKKRGLGLQKVAELSGMSSNSIYRYNQGYEPSTNSLKAIANTLGVSPSELLSEPGEHKSEAIDIKDDEVILSFDGLPIPEEDRAKILEYAQFVLDQRKGK